MVRAGQRGKNPTRNSARSRYCKPRFELLEDRTVPSGFVDGFEGPALDPFWTATTESGSITFPSTAQVHSGNQSVQLNSIQTSQQKNVWIEHTFPQAVYGRFSVWVYDTGANASSSNYIGMYISNSTTLAGIQGWDFNFGDGATYNPQFGNESFSSGVARTSGWHRFEIETTPSSTHFSIDGNLVASRPAMDVQTVRLLMYGPSWRPAWVSYFDDFEFVPYNETQTVQIDIKPGDANNTTNVVSNGTIAVSLLTTDSFDAANVDISTVFFAGAAVAQSAYEDIDGDGDLDLVMHFRTNETTLEQLYLDLLADDLDGDGVLDSKKQLAEVSLTGETTDGSGFEGTDTMNLFLSGKALREALDQLFE